MATTASIASALASAASIGNSFGLFGGGDDDDGPDFGEIVAAMRPVLFGPALASTIASAIFGGEPPPGTQDLVDEHIFQQVFDAADIFRRPLPLNAIELGGFQLAEGGLGPRFAERTIGDLERVAEVAREAAFTGFPTDVSQLFEAVVQNRLPKLQAQVAERFGDQANRGSAFEFALASEVLNPLAELEANLGFQAAEAAAGRRLSALPQAARLTGLPAQVRIGLAQDLVNLGQQKRVRDELGRPLARALLGFPEIGQPSPVANMIQLANQQQFFTPFPTAGTFPSGNLFSIGGLGAIAKALPSVVQVGRDIAGVFGFGGGGGGGGAVAPTTMPNISLPSLENIRPNFPDIFDLDINPDFGFGSPQAASIVNLSSVF